MINISKLYLGRDSASDARVSPLRAQPVVVWNCTRRCNLQCVHCYAEASVTGGANELSTTEGRSLLDDLAAFGAPVVLFSGGEPLLREDLFDLIDHGVKLGLRAVLSTNGTLIDEKTALRLRDAGVSYAGISLDGLRETNDRFRKAIGGFDLALRGIRNCLSAGLRTGLRLTVTRDNVADISGVFDLIEAERIPRVCFYHLAYSGRGAAMMHDDLSHEETRRVIDRIIDRTALLHERGFPVEMLTVDNHADGPYLYLRMLREKRPDAARTLELLRRNGGNSSGEGIGCVSWDGSVHPDQFWRSRCLGNVRQRRFSEIWTDVSNPLLAALRDKRRHVKGRCARCRFLDACGGNLRARAEAATGDTWAPDPACYLTDKEIAPDATLRSTRPSRDD